MPLIYMMFLGLVGFAAVAVVWWLFRHVRSILRGDWQAAEGTRMPWWLPGQGGHGADGGQSPPFVPYSEEWDPKNRIR